MLALHSLEAIVEDPEEVPKVVCGVGDMDHDAPFDRVIWVDHDVELVRECLRITGVIEELYKSGRVPREHTSVHPEAGLLGNDDDVAVLEP